MGKHASNKASKGLMGIHGNGARPNRPSSRHAPSSSNRGAHRNSATKESFYLRPLKRSKARLRPFCTYDIETLTDLEHVYLLGFFDGTIYRHFESKPMRPESPGSPIDQFCRWIFGRDDYAHRYIYAHNGGAFDALYLTTWLLQHRKDFSLSVVPLQSSILSLEVQSKRRRNGKWKFVDSARLLPGKLDDLMKAFGMPGGKVKDIDYETLHLDPRRYAYLETDCRGLYHCIQRFNQLVFEAGGDVSLTAPGTAMKTFRRRFLSYPIPITRHFMECVCDENG